MVWVLVKLVRFRRHRREGEMLTKVSWCWGQWGKILTLFISTVTLYNLILLLYCACVHMWSYMLCMYTNTYIYTVCILYGHVPFHCEQTTKQKHLNHGGQMPTEFSGFVPKWVNKSSLFRVCRGWKPTQSSNASFHKTMKQGSLFEHPGFMESIQLRFFCRSSDEFLSLPLGLDLDPPKGIIFKFIQLPHGHGYFVPKRWVNTGLLKPNIWIYIYGNCAICLYLGVNMFFLESFDSLQLPAALPLIFNELHPAFCHFFVGSSVSHRQEMKNV